ncbi:hypothetical protein ICC18_14150 [Paenibacillus sp. WST5]|uniref:FtsK domain-containing protein n=1 Tax=Paenibacillus sedimenti TaxID=2770274 RepID=A0A926KS46_9BACL|nr:hypothetical protein [Paenibacillus sedimenti]
MNTYRERIKSVLSRIVKPSDIKEGLTKGFVFQAEREHNNAYESAWRIPAGYSFTHVQAQRKALSAACGGTVELEDRGGVVIIRVLDKDFPDRIELKPDMIRPGELLLGFDQRANRILHDFKHPHMIIGAETGWGKTELIRLINYQLCRNHSPDEIEICMVDLKGGVSFLPFASVPHVTKIAHDLETAFELVEQTYQMVQRRLMYVRMNGSRKEFGVYKRRFIIVDEAAQVAPVTITDKEERKIAQHIDSRLGSIASIGREPGVNLIYCTQYPHSSIVNPSVRINCGARICFHVPSDVFSHVVLDCAGAEELPVPGRAIYKTTKYQTIQVPYLPPEKGHSDNDSAWEKLLQPLKTEVINGGKSGRREKERIVIDARIGSSFNNGSNSPADVFGRGQSGQAGISNVQGIGARKDFGGQATSGYEEGMETYAQWAERERRNTAAGAAQYTEDDALVDDI